MERKKIAREEKRLEFLTALAGHLKRLFAAEPGKLELRLEPNQLIRLIRNARLPVWTYSDIEICKVVGDALHWGEILMGRNEHHARGGRSGVVIFYEEKH